MCVCVVCTGSIDIVLGETAEFRDQLMACYHAEVIDYCYTAVRCSTSKVSDIHYNDAVCAVCVLCV